MEKEGRKKEGIWSNKEERMSYKATNLAINCGLKNDCLSFIFIPDISDGGSYGAAYLPFASSFLQSRASPQFQTHPPLGL